MLILVCASLAVLAGFYVLVPLFREPKGNLEAELLAETELDRLLNRKAVVYTNLKDLQFEYKMGRLSDGDFSRLEAGYKGEAAVILNKLDQLGVAKDIDEAIERDVGLRKSRHKSPDAELPSASGKCPSCGVEVIPGKPFCADCGRSLLEEQSP